MACDGQSDDLLWCRVWTSTDLVHDCLWVSRPGHDNPVSFLHDFTISLKGSKTGLLLSPFLLPTALHFFYLSVYFVWASILLGAGWLKTSLFFQKAKLWAAVTYPAAAAPAVSDAVGLHTEASPFSCCWWLISVCRPGECHYDSGWALGTKWGCTAERFLTGSRFLCLLPVFSFAMKSTVSVLLTVYRQVWKEIQTGLYFMQDQNRKSISLAENQSEVWLKWNVFSLVLLLRHNSHKWMTELMLV